MGRNTLTCSFTCTLSSSAGGWGHGAKTPNCCHPAQEQCHPTHELLESSVWSHHTPPLGGRLGREVYFKGVRDVPPFPTLSGRTFPRELVTLPRGSPGVGSSQLAGLWKPEDLEGRHRGRTRVCGRGFVLLRVLKHYMQCVWAFPMILGQSLPAPTSPGSSRLQYQPGSSLRDGGESPHSCSQRSAHITSHQGPPSANDLSLFGLLSHPQHGGPGWDLQKKLGLSLCFSSEFT